MEVPVFLWRFSQVRSAAVSAADGIEGGVRAVEFHLMDEFKQFPELSLGKAFSLEPGEILVGQIDDGRAVGREIVRTVLAEGHVPAFQSAEQALDGFLEL